MKKNNPQKPFLIKLKVDDIESIARSDDDFYKGKVRTSNVGEMFPSLTEKELSLVHIFFRHKGDNLNGFEPLIDRIRQSALDTVHEKLYQRHAPFSHKRGDLVEELEHIKEGYRREIHQIIGKTTEKYGKDRFNTKHWYIGDSSDPRYTTMTQDELIPVKNFKQMISEYFEVGFSEYQKEYFIDRLKDLFNAQYLFDRINLSLIKTKPIVSDPSYRQAPQFSVIQDNAKIEGTFEQNYIFILIRIEYYQPLRVTFKLEFKKDLKLHMGIKLSYFQLDKDNTLTSLSASYPFNLIGKGNKTFRSNVSRYKSTDKQFNNELSEVIDLNKIDLYENDIFYDFRNRGIKEPLKNKLFGLKEDNTPVVSWSTPPFVLFNKTITTLYSYDKHRLDKLAEKNRWYKNKMTSAEIEELATLRVKRHKFANIIELPYAKLKIFFTNLIKFYFGKNVSDKFYFGKNEDDRGNKKNDGRLVIQPREGHIFNYYYLIFDIVSLETQNRNHPSHRGISHFAFKLSNDYHSHYITSYFAPILVDALTMFIKNDFKWDKYWQPTGYLKTMGKFRHNAKQYNAWMKKIEQQGIKFNKQEQEYYIRELYLLFKYDFISETVYHNNRSKIQKMRVRNNPRRYKYMSLEEIAPFESLMQEKRVSEVARGVQPSNQTNTGFLVAYKRVKGDVSKIEQKENGFGDQTWGERRHGFISRHAKQMQNEKAFDEQGNPTRRHLGLIAWAYTPYPQRISTWIKNNKRKNPSKKFICTVHKLSSKGVHEIIGKITIEKDKNGLIFHVDVKDVPQGEHGFHIHEFGNLNPKLKKDKMIAGGSAGSHFDPYNAGFHGHPNGHGHLGDLPKLTSDKNGVIKQTVRQDRIKDLDMIKGRSLIIHRYGDNYSDNPLPNGGGKSRYAGAIIENSCRYCEKRNNPKKKETRDDEGLLIPQKYLKGFKGKEREKRIKEIGERRKQYKHIFDKAKKEGRKPTRKEYDLIYRPFETDKAKKGTKKKLSPYTQEAHKRGFTGSLKNKQRVASEYYKGEIPYSTLKKIYDKGKAAWASGGHRKYQTPQSWGNARVNSFLVGGKAFFTADNKLARETLPTNVYNTIKKKAVWSVKLNKIVRKNPQSYPNANLIYGRAMAEKDWYKPLHHYDYYYHVPKENKLINTDKLLDSIDKDIYEIVRIAHEKGLSTDSSCQGHFFTIKELKDKYKKAKQDEKQIREKGLILENVETGEHILWNQKDYKFPYTQEKYIEIMRKKPRGYLPIYLHEPQCVICEDLDKQQIPYNFVSDKGLLEFVIDEKTNEDQAKKWNEIQGVFKKHYK